ncbi:MAG: hypothetical protein HDQ97_17940 [Lachnospiraceae bacterium]|nr:hypothetical protein [Lachnospiraceae bacterium]
MKKNLYVVIVMLILFLVGCGDSASDITSAPAEPATSIEETTFSEQTSEPLAVEENDSEDMGIDLASGPALTIRSVVPKENCHIMLNGRTGALLKKRFR